MWPRATGCQPAADAKPASSRLRNSIVGSPPSRYDGADPQGTAGPEGRGEPAKPHLVLVCLIANGKLARCLSEVLRLSILEAQHFRLTGAQPRS